MAEKDELVQRARKTANRYGGLLSLLLAVRAGEKIEFSGAEFFINGKRIPAELIQKELERIELRIAATVALYNKRLWDKEWTLSKWREEMEKLLEDSHHIFGALALGSIASAVDDETVIRRLQRDKEALVRFARAIASKQIPSLGMMLNRGRAYIRSFYITFQLLNHKAHIAAGFTEAKRILTPAEHCRTQKKGVPIEGCYEAAVRGWMPIRNMPPIGTLVCGQFCKCFMVYR